MAFAKKDLAQHFSDLKSYVDQDIRKVLAFHEKRHSLGILPGVHSVASVAFCLIDYLGLLCYGKSRSANAVKFMRTYLGGGYRDVSVLLYSMWRHGIVHEHSPKVLTDGARKIAWCVVILDKAENRAEHLKVFEVEGRPNSFRFVLNLNQFADDIYRGLEAVERDVGIHPAIEENYQKILLAEDVHCQPDVHKAFRWAVVNFDKYRFIQLPTGELVPRPKTVK